MGATIVGTNLAGTDTIDAMGIKPRTEILKFFLEALKSLDLVDFLNSLRAHSLNVKMVDALKIS